MPRQRLRHVAKQIDARDLFMRHATNLARKLLTVLSRPRVQVAVEGLQISKTRVKAATTRSTRGGAVARVRVRDH